MLLCVSCSGPEASVALASADGKLVGVRRNGEPRSHAEFLNAAIEELLELQNAKLEDISEFGVDVGPGSFTGIRIGVSFAKAVSYLQAKPVWISSSLLLQGTGHSSDSLRLTVIDGFNGVYYHWLRDPSTKGELDFLTSTPEALVAAVRSHPAFRSESKVLVDGSGLQKFRSVFERHGLLADFHSTKVAMAENLMLLIQAHSPFLQKKRWNEIFPLYLRASAAEEKGT